MFTVNRHLLFSGSSHTYIVFPFHSEHQFSKSKGRNLSFFLFFCPPQGSEDQIGADVSDFYSCFPDYSYSLTYYHRKTHREQKQFCSISSSQRNVSQTHLPFHRYVFALDISCQSVSDGCSFAEKTESVPMAPKVHPCARETSDIQEHGICAESPHYVGISLKRGFWKLRQCTLTKPPQVLP